MGRSSDDHHYVNTQPLKGEGIGKASIITSLPKRWCTTGIRDPGVLSLPCGEVAPGWRLKRAIPLAVERDEADLWLVSDSLFLCYGSGESLEQAMQDYVADLTHYANVVERYANQGYAGNLALRDLLREYIAQEG